jgi:hypothetical protein
LTKEEEEMQEKFKEIISFSKVEDDDDNEINFLNESSIFCSFIELSKGVMAGSVKMMSLV